jgi:hypothetical protein
VVPTDTEFFPLKPKGRLGHAWTLQFINFVIPDLLYLALVHPHAAHGLRENIFSFSSCVSLFEKNILLIRLEFHAFNNSESMFFVEGKQDCVKTSTKMPKERR